MADRQIFSRSAVLIGSDGDRGDVVGMGDSVSATDGTECHVCNTGATFLGVLSTRTKQNERATYVTLGEVDVTITDGETITFGEGLKLSGTAGELIAAAAAGDVVVAESRGETASGGEAIPVWLFGTTRLGSDYGLA